MLSINGLRYGIQAVTILTHATIWLQTVGSQSSYVKSWLGYEFLNTRSWIIAGITTLYRWLSATVLCIERRM